MIEKEGQERYRQRRCQRMDVQFRTMDPSWDAVQP